MTPIIGYARNLPGHSNLADLGLDFRYAWLEGTLEAQLTWLKDAGDWHNITRWPAGRLFGENGEYRWQMEPEGTIHAVLILDDGQLPLLFTANPALPLQHEGDSPLILYGDWVDPNKDQEGNPDGGPWFYAREIPRPQYYPVEVEPESFRKSEGNPAKRPIPRLVVRRYRHVPQDDEPNRGVFLRCVGITLQPAAGQREETAP